jgi:hypothetical protein
MRVARRLDMSTFDVIWLSYYGKEDIELTDKEKDIKERWFFAWAQLLEMNTNRDVIASLAKQYNISERQASEDVKNALRLFNDPRKAVKESKRIILEHWVVNAIKKANKENDTANLEKLFRRYSKINKLEDDDDDKKPERPPIQINFNADPDTLKKQQEELRKKAMVANAQDTDFETVDND